MHLNSALGQERSINPNNDGYISLNPTNHRLQLIYILWYRFLLQPCLSCNGRKFALLSKVRYIYIHFCQIKWEHIWVPFNRSREKWLSDQGFTPSWVSLPARLTVYTVYMERLICAALLGICSMLQNGVLVTSIICWALWCELGLQHFQCMMRNKQFLSW